MSVTYEISGQNEEPAFSITYEAAPDQDTLISMTPVSYTHLLILAAESVMARNLKLFRSEDHLEDV